MSAAAPARDDLLDALRAVLDALDIPHPATVGDSEAHARILNMRVMHAVVMLQSVMRTADRREPSSARQWTPGDLREVRWSTEYLRDRLAEHPAEGRYKTWQQLVAELDAARESGGAR